MLVPNHFYYMASPYIVGDPITSLAITVPYFWARQQHHQLIPLKSTGESLVKSQHFPNDMAIIGGIPHFLYTYIYANYNTRVSTVSIKWGITNLGLFIYLYSSMHHPILNGYWVWLQSKPLEILEWFEYPTIKLPNCWLTYPNIYLVTPKNPTDRYCFSHFPTCSARISQFFHKNSAKDSPHHILDCQRMINFPKMLPKCWWWDPNFWCFNRK